MKSLSFNFLFSYSLNETKKRKCYFCLSFFCCFLVALFSLVINSILNQSPIIFLILAENNVGEIDIKISTSPKELFVTSNSYSNQVFYGFLNHTLIQKQISNSKLPISSSPRMNISGIETFSNGSITIIAMDTIKEKSIGLGSSYPYPALNKGECNIMRSLANNLKLKTGDNLPLLVDISLFLKNTIIENFPQTDQLMSDIESLDNYQLKMNCTVKNIMSSVYGKSGSSGNLIFFEFKNFLPHISDFIDPNMRTNYKNLANIISGLDLNQYTNNIMLNFEGQRVNNYLNSDYNSLLLSISQLVNSLILSIGPNNNIAYSLPLANELKPLYQGAIFLTLILNLSIIILFFLSIVLIYSLLTITVETSSLDLGILRLIGSNKKEIIWIIVFQCFFFSIPSFIVAFIVQFPLYKIFSMVLTSMSGADVSIPPSFNSIILAFFLCNLGPLIASIIPIKDILSKNLSDSLNTKQSKTSGVKIEVLSLNEEQKITMIIFGFLTFFYGISIYYFLPLTLLSMNLGLLLLIFMVILIGMLIGLITLSLNIEHISQKIIAYIFLFWTGSHVKDIIFKNLTSHKIRNRKTSLMYSLSVGLYIMVTVGFTVQITSQKFTRLGNNGAYMVLTSSNGFLTPKSIDEDLNTLLKLNLIKNYSYIMPSIISVNTTKISSVSLTNLGKSVVFPIDFFGVTPNFYNNTVNDFLIIDSVLKDYKMPLSEMLNLKEMDGRLLASTYFTNQFNLEIDDYFFLNLKDNQNNNMEILFKPLSLLKNSPSIFMSDQATNARKRGLIASVPLYTDLLIKAQNFIYDNSDPVIISYSYQNLPISQIILNVDPGISDDNYDKLVNVINANQNYTVSIWSYSTFSEVINRTTTLMNYFFGFINIIVFIFCFFNLSASMTINILEQSKEIAIYRSLGLTKVYLKFIYISEAFTLILASSIVGLIIGTLISWTMTLQQMIFTNLPLTFIFPVQQLIIILIISFIGSFICTISPANRILGKEISVIMKY